GCAPRGLVNFGGATDFPGAPRLLTLEAMEWFGLLRRSRVDIWPVQLLVALRAGQRAKPVALVKPMNIAGSEHESLQSLEGGMPDHHHDRPPSPSSPTTLFEHGDVVQVAFGPYSKSRALEGLLVPAADVHRSRRTR